MRSAHWLEATRCGWPIPFARASLFGQRHPLMKVLIVGLGSIGQRHVRNLRALLGRKVEISAYRVRMLTNVLTEDFEIESGSNVEEKYGIQVYGNLDQALSQKPQVVFVCNPTSF